MPRSRSRSPESRSSRPRYDGDRYKDERQKRSTYSDRERDYERRDRDRKSSDKGYNKSGRDGRQRSPEGMRDRRRDSKERASTSHRDRDRGKDRERDRGGGRDRDRDRDDYGSRRGPPNRPLSRSQSPSTSGPKKDQPNFGASGLLAAATNTVKNKDGTATLLKYNEPPEARKPSQGWRLYMFKGQEDLGLLYIEKQSAYLIGRDQAVADIPIDHPSCSKQHAVIQYRQVLEKDEWGVAKPAVKPFIIDLESTNGTHINGAMIPTSRYYELKPSDVIKFGQSTREYVLLHED